MQAGSSSNAQGVDVSQYQGRVNWKLVKQSGKVDFVYTRASIGTQADTTFHTNWGQLHSHYLIRGAYHVAQVQSGSTTAIQTHATQQATFFLKTLAAAGGQLSYDLPPALDIEQNQGLTATELELWISTWLATVDHSINRSSQASMIYSYAAFLNTFLPHTSPLCQRRLWIADYSSRPPNTGCWTQWNLWQYQNSGHIPGLSTAVDLDEWFQPAADLPHRPSPTPPAHPRPHFCQF